tara:strand:+ start:2685 stop:2903 length:219 start_codon:yes stop_codon:yes gene_type:complete
MEAIPKEKLWCMLSLSELKSDERELFWSLATVSLILVVGMFVLNWTPDELVRRPNKIRTETLFKVLLIFRRR